MAHLENREKVFRYLEQLGLEYSVTEHPAVYTIEEMNGLGINLLGDVCKNLFLRDSSGKRHFLVTMPSDRKAPLKILQQQLGTSRLGFASEDRLARFLKLHQGEVSPFGVLNDDDCAVELVFDSALEGNPRLGLHPNDNTATVWISFENLCKAIAAHGNRMHILPLNG